MLTVFLMSLVSVSSSGSTFRLSQAALALEGLYMGKPKRSSVFALGQAREPGEIGLALLQEGILALLTLFGHVVEHGGVASQFLNTGKAVRVRVESRFEEAQGKRAFLQYLAGPLYGLFFQALKGHDSVDQSHVEGLLGCILATEIPDLTGFFVSHDACHLGSTPTGVKAANFRAGLPKPGVVSGNRQVAEEV